MSANNIRKMQAEELDAVKNELLERLSRLWREIAADLENDTGKNHRDVIDIIKENGDIGLEELRQSNAFALIELKYEELLKIEDALERIEEGGYGRCVDCQKWIRPERLKAVPYAIRCLKCQAKFEKGAAMMSA